MNRIYLDHAATTLPRPEVEEAMAEVRREAPGNPSSPHSWGREARRRLEEARREVGELLGADPEEIFFVRGGTESDNLAVTGRVMVQASRPDRAGSDPDAAVPAVALSAVEHSAVREAAQAAHERYGAPLLPLPVARDGRVDPTPLRDHLRASGTVAVASVQLVNAEASLVLDSEELREFCCSAGVSVHMDAVQGVGRVPLPDGKASPHLLSLSAHKLGGPGGSGILLRRRGVELAPVLLGGGQEGGVRPGTVDVAAAVGTATALALAMESRESESARLRALRDGLEARLTSRFPGLRVLGQEGRRVPHILTVAVPGLPRDLLPGALDLEGVGVSAGSACRSGATSVSPVLSALYGEEAAGWGPMRISLGWTTTEEEVREAGDRILRVLSRVWTGDAEAAAEVDSHPGLTG